MGTRRTNADSHPGDVVEKQKRKRRTKAEIEADKAEKARLKEEQLEKKTQGVKRIAQIENTIAEEDANLVTPKPRPKPRPLQRTTAYLTLPQQIPEDDRPVPREVPSDGPETSDYEPPSVKEHETSEVEMTGEDTEDMDGSPPKKKGKSAKADKGSRSNTHHTNAEPTGTDGPPELPKNKKVKALVRDAIKKARQSTEGDEVEVLSDVTVRQPHASGNRGAPKVSVVSHPLTHAHTKRNDSFLLFSEQR
jgi:hypothetical protein